MAGVRVRRDINGVGADRDVETGIIMIDGGMGVIERCRGG